MARDLQITFDCADPAGLAAFWAEAMSYKLQDPPDGFESWDQALDAWGVPPENRNDASAVVDPAGAGPRMYFQRVPEGKPCAVVRNFMAHHHGMSIVAVANALFEGRMRDRFHSDPVIKAAEPLLRCRQEHND
jgi:hypothetical protein